MPQVQKAPQPKRETKKAARDRVARLNRGTQAITDLLKKEKLILTSRKVRLLWKDNGATRGGDAISYETLAHICGLPSGTMLIPQFEVEAQRDPTPSAN